ncbi:MAG: thymidylate kinase [Candidatus Brocadiia bacterium]|jgi:dTMP kinase|nr:thymidylate kinase [Candidatus Brocadiia bacterium]
MAKKGRLIAICGIDGSGKTVQSALLAERAQASGWRVETIGFPRYTEGLFGELVARYLRGEFASTAQEVSPYLAALPFACDRWQAGPQLRSWLADEAAVICNRYVSANMAHQGAKIRDRAERRHFLDWVAELEYGVFDLPRPDLHVLLDVTPAVSARLVAGKGKRAYLKEGRDIHESDAAYLKDTWELYDELAESASDWVRIKCAPGGDLLGPEQIAEEVWRAARPVLEGGAR